MGNIHSGVVETGAIRHWQAVGRLLHGLDAHLPEQQLRELSFELRECCIQEAIVEGDQDHIDALLR